ncbi:MULTISPECIES: aldehyde dehydrogenase family protein [unclassified Roseateles]|uniref:aldehyde dehydrogenase family protein n=1 Tax=unclassified Roseateles TaxID=2626991 RepID=UPI0006FB0043|nr:MULTISPECIES: aldehyde dehydrogenase family protein [unclassified Roseateles]KQW44877.1 aldehyde dehydrogenase [Pelomonas sp. Root405]KRA70236.1 aldehyde dehydrogenase [Pelomonas sp. Root662]
MSICSYPCARVGRDILYAADDSTPVFAACDGSLFAWQGTATAAQIDQAVAAARAAWPAWRSTTAAQRGALLRAVAERIETERETLVQLQMRVNGKPRFEAELDVGDAAACFAFYAELCLRGDAFAVEPVAVPDATVSARRRHEPVGVAALVVPWNFPIVTTAWKLAPALATGCTVVLKPSELTSPAEHALLDILDRVGLPAGVVNMVCGGAAVGAALVAHPGVDKISFTGSTAVGRQVMKVAADHLKRVTLELGGKSALIVREDADLALAVSLAVGGAFTNAGQMCSATSRILVHQRVHARFLREFGAAVQALMTGPPGKPGCAMGPLISSQHRARVQALVNQGLAAGADVLFSGRVADGAGDGYFMAPLIVAPASEQNPLWQDEIFGPVACVRPFDTDAEALAAANATAYGLVATVVTRSAEAADLYQGELRAGLVWVNTPQLIFPQVCWGGLGASGLGRELGLEGLRAFQELRHAVAARPA